MDSPVAVYVHIPFCPSKCGYCDFNSYAMDGDIIERTVQAIRAEILNSPWAGRPAKTIFFGGGTPTYLSSPQLVSVLESVLQTHPPIDGCEITSEANPGTVDIPKFADMRAAGFNRISLGAQSFDTGDLHRLGRVHQAPEIGRAVTSARKAGFKSLNLDLMFALPGQSMRGWRNNLDLAMQMEPDHLSLYCLTIEQNTRFYKLHLRGLLDLPDDDAQVEMYDLAVETCLAHGLPQYEISNFAKPGYACRHNLEYWYGNDYLAYGPGAVGCVTNPDSTKTRYTNLKHPERYVEAFAPLLGFDAVENEEGGWGVETATNGSPILNPPITTDDQLPNNERQRATMIDGGHLPSPNNPQTPIQGHQFPRLETEIIDLPTQDFERLMLGLRLNEGVSRTVPHDLKQAKDLEKRGWLTLDPDRLVLTPLGRHFCSEATTRLAP